MAMLNNQRVYIFCSCFAICRIANMMSHGLAVTAVCKRKTMCLWPCFLVISKPSGLLHRDGWAMSFHGKERETISQQVKAPKQTISTGACQRRLVFTSRVNWQFLLECLDVTERTINTISTRLCLPKYGVSVVHLVMSTGFAAEAGCLRQRL